MNEQALLHRIFIEVRRKGCRGRGLTYGGGKLDECAVCAGSGSTVLAGDVFDKLAEHVDCSPAAREERKFVARIDAMLEPPEFLQVEPGRVQRIDPPLSIAEKEAAAVKVVVLVIALLALAIAGVAA